MELSSGEIGSLIDNIKYIEKQVPSILVAWKKERKRLYRRGCDEALTYYTGKPHRKNVIRRLCEEPTKYERLFFTPLYNWLEKYQKNRSGQLAFTKISLDNFLRRGIVLIHNFVVMSTYFADNIGNYTPKDFKTFERQRQFKEFVYRLNLKLIGCARNSIFPFLELSGTVQPLVDDLEDMRNFLSDQCALLRVKLLRT